MKFDNLFDAGGIFVTTESYILRRILPEEKEYYATLAQAENPEFLQTAANALAWDDLLSEDHLTCSILQRDTGAFCGFCQLQWVFSDVPELGIDLLPEYHKKGVASEVLLPFLTRAKDLLNNKYFYSKIKKNNIPSQKLAEKIGGICFGTKSLLPADFPAEMVPFAEKEFPDFFYLEYRFMEWDSSWWTLADHDVVPTPNAPEWLKFAYRKYISALKAKEKYNRMHNIFIDDTYDEPWHPLLIRMSEEELDLILFRNKKDNSTE